MLATHVPFRCVDEINWNGEGSASCCIGGVLEEEDGNSLITKYGESELLPTANTRRSLGLDSHISIHNENGFQLLVER